MRQEAIQKLTRDWNNLQIKARSSALKYRFEFRNVNVNVYFDYYDEEMPDLSIILVKDKDYYYTSLNIFNVNIHKEYLEAIPYNILGNIEDDDYHLNGFFDEIDNQILKLDPVGTSYTKDKIYKNTIKYTVANNPNRKDLPFLSGLRHNEKMSEDTFKRLHATFGIKNSVLKQIQDKKMTLVRTPYIDRRKDLVVVLNGTGIKL